MEERVKYEVGDIVKLKKPHPCGSREWKILRVGADFRLECLGCGHQVMMARPLVEKSARGLRKPEKRRKNREKPLDFAKNFWYYSNP